MQWAVVRDALRQAESRIESRHGLPIKVYGSGSQGYELLGSCLNRDEYWIGGDRVSAYHIWNNSDQRSRMLRKQAHEYWTFLFMTENLLGGRRYKGDRGVTYQPTQGNQKQTPTLPTPTGTVFVEPCLTGYDESPILAEWEHQLEYLMEKDTRNVRPDFLIAEPSVEEIPWGVWLLFSGGLADEQEHEAQWQSFRGKVRWVVECKHTIPKPRDLSQTLWYALAYDVPVALIVQETVDPETRQAFQTDAAQLDTPVRLVDGFRIGDWNRCPRQMAELLDR